MKILLKNNDLNEALTNVSDLGFVPTMGSLHKGHISLINNSKKTSYKTVVSIFVNPKQFNSKKDYKTYPKNINKDLSILKKLRVDYVFLPKKKTIYNSKRKYPIKLSKKDKILCAKYRKGHFEGVIDVMDRLTKLIKPKKIYMGEKDFQQLFLVKKFLEKRYKTKIISCKTIRNKDKLALSSRNSLLHKKDIFITEKIAKNLFLFKKKLVKSKNLSELLILKKMELINLYKIKIEYLELRNIFNLRKSNTTKNSKIFIAYYINKIRLIDNF